MIIRTMAPFHMRCKTCGNYIYRGTKFNSRVETIKGERYLGTIPIRRFYIRCTKCVATITFKTDPENQDYAMETGATRNFEANRMWNLMEKREADAVAEEERLNPMKALENRTAKSNQQMVMQENLEELFELAELTGDGQSAQLTALKKITDAKELEAKLRQLFLEKEILMVTKEQDLFRESEARMDDVDEAEEDDDQQEVRKILRDIKPGELLTLNMEEDTFHLPSLAQDKKNRKLKEATDREGTKKKFSTLVVKKSAAAKVPGQKTLSYRELQERRKQREEELKKEAEMKKESEEKLTSMMAAYGSSSSDEDEKPDTKAEVKAEQEKESVVQQSDDTANTEPVAAQPGDDVKFEPEEHDSQLPGNFFDDDSQAVKEEPGRKRKASASFGTQEFWSSVIKKKS